MTGIPQPVYWRILAICILLSIALWVAAILYASHRANEERERLCLVQYAFMAEYYRVQHQPPLLLRALPCDPNGQLRTERN